jgi:transposase
MTGRNRRNFSPEFRLEAAQLVLDQHYTVAAAATAMNVGKSTMDKWVRQLKEERAGKSPKASPMTPEQLRIRELEKRLQRVEMENDILKKATVDSTCQRNTLFKNLFWRLKFQCFPRPVV